MPDTEVVLIDTSVLLNLLNVPGFAADHVQVTQTFEALLKQGAKFVLPITTLIETGNHIAHCNGNRRGAAERFVRAVEAATASDPPWTIRDVLWGQETLKAILAGDSTGVDLVNHLSSKTLGAGDLALLVERDLFKAGTAFNRVRIWTLDLALDAYRL